MKPSQCIDYPGDPEYTEYEESLRGVSCENLKMTHIGHEAVKRVRFMDWVSILSGVYALFGGVILVAAARQFARRLIFLRHSAIASGTIVALTENREGGEISYFPQVKFQTPSGREVTFQSEMGTTSEARRIGHVVAVRYRPDQPHVAEIDSFMSLWGLTLLLAVLGAVFLFLGLGIPGGVLAI